jgi:isoleucyl-tRNA synthetase
MKDADKRTMHNLTGVYRDVSIVIWTTTPWTIPGNRAISFSPAIGYGVYEWRASSRVSHSTRG